MDFICQLRYPHHGERPRIDRGGRFRAARYVYREHHSHNDTGNLRGHRDCHRQFDHPDGYCKRHALGGFTGAVALTCAIAPVAASDRALCSLCHDQRYKRGNLYAHHHDDSVNDSGFDPT
jgi:hypothetical protein